MRALDTIKITKFESGIQYLNVFFFFFFFFAKLALLIDYN